MSERVPEFGREIAGIEMKKQIDFALDFVLLFNKAEDVPGTQAATLDYSQFDAVFEKHGFKLHYTCVDFFWMQAQNSIINHSNTETGRMDLRCIVWDIAHMLDHSLEQYEQHNVH